MSDQAALDLLDRFGPLLSASELARVIRLTPSQVYRNTRNGAYDFLKVQPVVGYRQFSKALIAKWLSGEPVTAERVFGRKRSA